MSIDDDYFDVLSATEGTIVEESFGRLASHMGSLEEENEQLYKRITDLENALRVLTEVKEKRTINTQRSSPYDLSKGNKGIRGLNLGDKE